MQRSGGRENNLTLRSYTYHPPASGTHQSLPLMSHDVSSPSDIASLGRKEKGARFECIHGVYGGGIARTRGLWIRNPYRRSCLTRGMNKQPLKITELN